MTSVEKKSSRGAKVRFVIFLVAAKINVIAAILAVTAHNHYGAGLSMVAAACLLLGAILQKRRGG